MMIHDSWWHSRPPASGTAMLNSQNLAPLLVSLLGLAVSIPRLQAQAASSSLPGGKEKSPALETARPGLFPEVVARVNGVEISKGELISRVEAVRAGIGLPSGDLPLSIYRTILDDLVEVELLYQSSRSAGYAASDQDVEEELSGLRARYDNDEQFLAQLEAESIDLDDLKEILRKDLSVQKLVDETLASRVVVTEEAKRKFYEENLAELRQPEQVRLRHILISAPEGSPEAETRAAREQIDQLRRSVVEDGADFSAVAREHSDDPESKNQGGELTISRGDSVPEFEEAAFQLEPGQVSEVVRTAFGFHIILVQEKIPGRTPGFEELEARIRQYLAQEEVQREVKAEVESLRSKSVVEVFI